MPARLYIAVRCFAIGLATVASAGTARAESCLDRVLGIAGTYGLATDPPTVGARDSDVTIEDLARSGGVVEPERLKDGMVIAPPRDKGYRMPTLPDVKERDLPGVDLTALQAILVAARAQAERGNEAGCWTTLEKVRTIVDRGR